MFLKEGLSRETIALVVGYLDLAGESGVKIDLDVLSVLKTRGVSIITGIVNSRESMNREIYTLPPEKVLREVESVTRFNRIKTGKVLFSRETVDVIRPILDRLEDLRVALVVELDTLGETSRNLIKEILGESLLIKILVADMRSIESVISRKVESLTTAREVSIELLKSLRIESLLILNVEISGKLVDLYYRRDGFEKQFSSLEIDENCRWISRQILSASILAFLAHGLSIEDSIERSREFLGEVYKYKTVIGRRCIMDPVSLIDVLANKYLAIENVERALELLIKHGEKVYEAVPEVGLNIAMSIPSHYVRDTRDVAGVKGRVVRYGDTIKPVGPVVMGGSSHLARLIIEVQKRDPSIRAAVNIRFREEYIERAVKKGLKTVFIDRTREPEDIKRIEGASMRWIVSKAFEILGETPDIIYDRGDIGKEAMIRILGREALEVVKKLFLILEE
ncbi:MAG: thiamine-phosphate synthase family protein [Sulfolobales archaeon]